MTSVVSFLFLVFNCTFFCCSLKVFTFISLYLYISLSFYLFFFNFLIFSSFISFLFSFSSILSPLLSFSHNSEAFHLTSACQLRSPPSLPPSPPGPAGGVGEGLGRGVWSPVLPFLLPVRPPAVCLLCRCGGVFWAPLEKTVIFLTAPESRDYAALSSLSDERQPTESRCARSFGCVGGILVFRDC